MKISTNSLNPSELLLEETLYHTANGYLGIRGNFEEGYQENAATVRGCYINAFYDIIDIKYPEKLFGFPETAQRLVNLPDLQTTKIYIDGEQFSLFEGKILEYRRESDMEAGTSLRSVRWRSRSGKNAMLTFKRMASFTRPELFLTEITVAAETSCELRVVSEAICAVYNYFDESDPRVASEREQYIHMEKTEINGDVGLALSRTSKSGLSVACAMAHSVNRPAQMQTSETAAGFKTEITLSLDDKPAVIGKFCSYADSRRHPNCSERSLTVLADALSTGTEILFAEQRAYLDAFWENSGVIIHGDEKFAEGMAFDLYGLLQSAGRDSVSNIASKGLSGEGYEGHYFWDTEIYMLPFFVLTMPERAKTLLEYRHALLDSAKKHARILGHEKGALYPWRTIAGSECSPYYPSGSAQYHINGDIAHAFMLYYHATKDITFMAEKGSEVLVETARFWANAGTYDRNGRLCYNGVTGPDEYTCMVNNNYFTNVSAKQNLLSAVYICDELKRAGMFCDFSARLCVDSAELEAFKKTANDIYIPYDEVLGINPQDDSFLNKEKWDLSALPKENFPLLTHYHPLCLYRTQVCKQADTVLAHYLYGGESESTIRKSYEYYEPITTHDSSLSKCTFGIMASYLGMPEKAYGYFLDVVRTDLDDSHGNTKDGIHAANMGGAYLAVVAGFAGLRIRQDGLHFKFTLPEQWTAYEFNVNFAGSRLHVSVTAGESEFRLKDGSRPVTVFVDGEAVHIEDARAVPFR